MTDKEIINTLVLAIIQPSVLKADYLGLEISADGLREVYAQIIDFYEMNKEKYGKVEFITQGHTENDR